jgi:hypothetical protein
LRSSASLTVSQLSAGFFQQPRENLKGRDTLNEQLVELARVLSSPLGMACWFPIYCELCFRGGACDCATTKQKKKTKKKDQKKKIETNETKQKPKNELTAVLRDISKAFINNLFTS